MSFEYSYFDGTPYEKQEIFGRHDWFYSDAYRTIANIALDNIWPGMEDDNYKLWSQNICTHLSAEISLLIKDACATVASRPAGCSTFSSVSLPSVV